MLTVSLVISSVEFREQIKTLLTDLGCTQAEVAMVIIIDPCHSITDSITFSLYKLCTGITV